jgi:hypothetical protein
MPFPCGAPPVTAVAIPAKDEADTIARCVHGLAHGTQAPDHIVLCVNNTTDDTIARARSVHLPRATTLHVIERALPPHLAHAGTARRLAMDQAARLAGPAGVILTTDADGVVDSTWLSANLAALAAGADVIAGWVDLDIESWHAIPGRLHDDDARECAYDSLCDEIHARLDPDPADPLPRHTQHSGASIALRAETYHRCGGLPPIPSGEDRAFIAAMRRTDARIRHSPHCHVTVSGRTTGRASGGMADTIRRRLTAPDAYLDERLEPAEACARRARLRAALRRCLTAPFLLPATSGQLRADPIALSRDLAERPFGAVWADLERTSPALARAPVAVADLPREMRVAQSICDMLRARDHAPAPSGRAPAPPIYAPT